MSEINKVVNIDGSNDIAPEETEFVNIKMVIDKRRWERFQKISKTMGISGEFLIRNLIDFLVLKNSSQEVQDRILGDENLKAMKVYRMLYKDDK